MDNRLLSRTDWDADSYLEAALRGELGDTPIELIDGEVVELAPPIGHPHGIGTALLHVRLARALEPQAWAVSGQSTVRLTQSDVPEPDVWVVRGGFDTLKGRYATADDLVLVVEVGASSRRFDRVVKLPRYALAGVPQLWLIDVIDQFIEVCTEPAGRDYLKRRRFVAGDTIVFTADGADLATLDVAELLP